MAATAFAFYHAGGALNTGAAIRNAENQCGRWIRRPPDWAICPFPANLTGRSMIAAHRPTEETGQSSVSASKVTIPARRQSLGLGVLLFLASLLVLWALVDVPRIPGSTVNANQNSVAVLPFENLSSDTEADYFSDGITDDITTQLAKIGGLRVTSRTSAMRYRESEHSIQEIARELGVENMIEGSVRRSGNRVRIVSKLVNAERDEHLWAETYDRELEDIFAIQSDVARNIAEALETQLTAAESNQIDKRPTANLTAYDYYLKGRDYYYRFRYQDNESAIELFEQSIDLDPDFAAAYAGLADGYVRRYYQFGLGPEWVDEAITLSQKALSIDPDCAEALKALGFAYSQNGWRAKALEVYTRSVELNPSYHPAVSNIAVILESQGRFDQAMRWSRRAVALNPTAAISYHNVGDVYRDLHDLSKAEEWYLRALEIEPDYATAVRGLTWVHISRGDFGKARDLVGSLLSKDPSSVIGQIAAGNTELYSGNHAEARQHYVKAIENSPGRFHAIANLRLGQLLWVAGQRDEAEPILSGYVEFQLASIENGSEHWWPRWILSVIHSIRGERDEAYTWFEKAVDAGWRPLLESWTAPEFENLAQDSRFQQRMDELKAEIGEMRERVKSDEAQTPRD